MHGILYDVYTFRYSVYTFRYSVYTFRYSVYTFRYSVYTFRYSVYTMECVCVYCVVCTFILCGVVFLDTITRYIISYQLKLIKLRAKLANLNHCAVPFLSRAIANLCWYSYTVYSRAHKLFGHLNARHSDFNINIIIPTRKFPLSVSN